MIKYTGNVWKFQGCHHCCSVCNQSAMDVNPVLNNSSTCPQARGYPTRKKQNCQNPHCWFDVDDDLALQILAVKLPSCKKSTQNEWTKASFFITLNHNFCVWRKKPKQTDVFRQHFGIESLEMETKDHHLHSQYQAFCHYKFFEVLRKRWRNTQLSRSFMFILCKVLAEILCRRSKNSTEFPLWGLLTQMNIFCLLDLNGHQKFLGNILPAWIHS